LVSVKNIIVIEQVIPLDLGRNKAGGCQIRRTLYRPILFFKITKVLFYQKAAADIRQLPFAFLYYRGPPFRFDVNEQHLRKVKFERKRMKNYKDTDYALNRYSKSIVYKFADGIVEIRLEDYLHENPEKTEEDFNKLKSLSDEIYYEQDRHLARTARLDVSIYCLKYTKDVLISSIIDVSEEKEKVKVMTIAKKLLNSKRLTEIQKRRFYLYFFEGLSTRQIAKRENVQQNAVWDSLRWTIKKLRKLFAE